MGAHVMSLAIHPSNPRTAYAATREGGLVFKTTDGGHSWFGVGVTGAPLYAVAIDPRAPDTVYAGGADGVFKSTDGGWTWTAVVPARGGEAVSALTVDARGAVYAGTDGVGHISIRVDGDSAWRTVLSDCATHVFVCHPRDVETVYAGTDRGVCVTEDGGVTWACNMPWTRRTAGPYTPELRALAIDVQEPRKLYAGSNGGRVYRSRDGGRRWTRTNADLYVVNALAADPATSGVVYACTDDGLFRTQDGGKTWTNQGGGWFLSIAIAPGPPVTIYTGADVVCRSTDGFETWNCAELGAKH